MNIFGLGTAEIILILVVMLLLFGKDKLPELAKSIGRSFKELKAGFDSPADDSTKDADKDSDQTKSDVNRKK